MDAELKASIEESITETVEEFQQLYAGLGRTVADGGTLSTRDMQALANANDRAQVSLSVQTAMQETDDLNRLVDKVQHMMDALVKQESISGARLRVLTGVLQLLRIEQKVQSRPA